MYLGLLFFILDIVPLLLLFLNINEFKNEMQFSALQF